MKELYEVGSIIKGKVTGIEKYGIFVSFANNYEGLIHISEISDYYVKNVTDYVSVGEVIYCLILGVDNENKKLKLSIKNINYKLDNGNELQETRLGFLPLKEKLDSWIEEKLKLYKEDDSNHF